MKLLTKKLIRSLPALGATENEPNPIVRVRLFSPDANWSWYLIEFDRVDTLYGLVSGLETEVGYFSLSELKKVRGILGLSIERDLYFRPRPLLEVKEELLNCN